MLNCKLQDTNYRAKVVKIDRLEPHPAADRIQIAIVDFQRIITGLETKIGDLFIYFPLESQLNKELVSFFNGYEDSSLNVDKTAKSFFNKHARVRALKLRNVVSEGYIHPVKSVNDYLKSQGIKFQITEKEVGAEFDSIGDVVFCQKYVNQGTKNKGPSGNPNKKLKKLSKIIDGQMRLHADTSQLKRNIDKVDPESIISITNKIHGCVKWDTLIETEEFGEVSIKEIVDNKKKVSILAFDTELKQKVFAPIDDFFFEEKNGDWYILEMDDGTFLEITSDNPVWMPDLECYRPAKDLKVGDFLLSSA